MKLSNCLSKLKMSKNEIVVLLIALLVSLVARGAALFPLSYAIDDFSKMLIPSSHSGGLEEFLSQGRFGLALLSKFAYVLGAGTPHTNTFYALFYMTSLAWVGIIVCRIWKTNDNVLVSTLIVLMISIHSYQAELFTFKISPFYIAVSYLAAFSAFYIVEYKMSSYAIANVLMVLSLSVYQISLNMIFVVLCIALSLEITSQIINSKAINWQLACENTKLLVRSMLLCTGVMLYLLINKIVQITCNVSPKERSLFIGSSELSTRFGEIIHTFNKIYFESEPVLSASVKKILLALLILSAFFIFKNAINCQNLNKVLTLITISCSVMLAAIGILGVIIPMQSWWPVPRVLSGVSFFWAGIIAIAHLNATKAEEKFIVIGLSCLVLYSFVGINNHIFTDQLRVNMRDLHKANRIVAKIENHPEFRHVRKVALIGTSWAYPAPIYTAQGDMNISAFGAAWSKLNVLKEVSGYDFAPATADEQKIADRFCEHAPKWPIENSIAVINDLCIVCM